MTLQHIVLFSFPTALSASDEERLRAMVASWPREIGLMLIVTAPSQELATEAARVSNPLFFHFPVREGSELPSYAFPFSPAEIERGQVFEFHLNHVVHTTSPFELVRTRWIDLAAAPRKAAIA